MKMKYAFDVNPVLLETTVVRQCEPSLTTKLVIDASRFGVLGFVLQQKHSDPVQFGSRLITDTESRYAMIGLECLQLVRLY